MNHDPTPTSLAASHPTLPRRDDEAAAAPSSSLGDDGGRQSDVPTPDTASRRSSLSKKAKDGLGKKLAFLTHLLGCLDTLIYAELCTLYYMEYVVLLHMHKGVSNLACLQVFLLPAVPSVATAMDLLDPQARKHHLPPPQLPGQRHRRAEPPLHVPAYSDLVAPGQRGVEGLPPRRSFG